MTAVNLRRYEVRVAPIATATGTLRDVLPILELANDTPPLTPFGVRRQLATKSFAAPHFQYRPPVFNMISCETVGVDYFTARVVHQFMPQSSCTPSISPFDLLDCLTCAGGEFAPVH